MSIACLSPMSAICLSVESCVSRLLLNLNFLSYVHSPDGAYIPASAGLVGLELRLMFLFLELGWLHSVGTNSDFPYRLSGCRMIKRLLFCESTGCLRPSALMVEARVWYHLGAQPANRASTS